MTLEIIIPVRNMRDHVDACVRSLVGQLDPADVLTVVDDDSEDGTGEIARAAGARVVRNTPSQGPYRARQAAAWRSDAQNLVFIDARGRARPGLLAAHRRLLADSTAALSCTNVHIVSGRSFASRVSAQSGLFDVSTKVGVPGQLDFFPTCNLGVRRDVFLAVGGFRQMRSGGDIDLCWRVQQAGLGRMAAESRTLLDWVPRDSFRALVEQHYRYGRSAAWLEELFPDARVPVRDPGSVANPPAGGAGRVLTYVRAVAADSRERPDLVALRAAGRGLALVQEFGLRRARRSAEIRTLPPPVDVTDAPS